MKKFEIPEAEVIHFVKKDIIVTSCPTDCICVECKPCAEGDHCTYFDTCPEHCARYDNCNNNAP